MNVRVDPGSGVRGRFRVPGDKSVSHRLALLGALAQGESRFAGFSPAADCRATVRCLEQLGVAFGREGDTLVVDGRGPDGLRPPAGTLDAANSGSTLRMLAGVLAGRPFRSVISGDASLRRRPVERVAVPLRAMGARVTTADGCPPVEILGAALTGIAWVPDVASAQVKTAVLLAGLHAQGRTEVREPTPSRDHTERLLPLFGAELEHGVGAVSVVGGQHLRGASLAVPGDPSSAAFLVVAAVVLGGSHLRLDGVSLNPTRSAYLAVLRRLGADVSWEAAPDEGPEPVGWIEARASRLGSASVGPAEVPLLVDELPALAVAAACAGGRLEVSGAEELRVKESDRIAALEEGFARLGLPFEPRPDGFLVEAGPRPRGAALRTHGDHRIAMALAVAALAADGPSSLDDGACVDVSFPGFFEVLAEAARA